MNRRRVLALAPSALLSAAGLTFAQSSPGTDPPIIIGDGSLRLASPRAAWSNWAASSDSERALPEAALSLGEVRVQSPGNDSTVNLNGRRAQITVVSGSTTVEVLTSSDGRAVRLRIRGKRFTEFRASDDQKTLVLETNSSISSIQVRREGQTILQLSGLTPTTTVTILPAS